jgi:uncharacterized protein YutE (UPF0331/DUF86 family)
LRDIQDKGLNNRDKETILFHNLRRAPEVVFDIGNHILSRLPIPPGERPTMYKEIALAL